MNKEERIRRYGEVAYAKLLQQRRDWRRDHPKEVKERDQEWKRTHRKEIRESDRLRCLDNPDRVKANSQEISRKDGKYYERHRKYFSTGIPHEKELVRGNHGCLYRPYKQIIAPDSQIHHEWLPDSANFRGVALVEKNQHMHGFVEVIQILEGEITLLTEEEIKIGGGI